MGKKIRFLFIFNKRPPVFAEFQYYHFPICFLKSLSEGQRNDGNQYANEAAFC